MLVVGMLIGSMLGEVISLVLPDGVVKQFFLKSITPGFQLTQIDLEVVKITLGLELKLNIISILGVLLAVYLFRWY
jgi:hypothetical protein